MSTYCLDLSFVLVQHLLCILCLALLFLKGSVEVVRLLAYRVERFDTSRYSSSTRHRAVHLLKIYVGVDNVKLDLFKKRNQKTATNINIKIMKNFNFCSAATSARKLTQKNRRKQPGAWMGRKNRVWASLEITMDSQLDLNAVAYISKIALKYRIGHQNTENRIEISNTVLKYRPLFFLLVSNTKGGCQLFKFRFVSPKNAEDMAV